MSKRRISKQQSQRIIKKHESYHNGGDRMEEAATGLVITRFGSHALIKDEQGAPFHCSIRPSVDSLVAGDRVVWLPEGAEQGVVVSRYQRKSVLGRPDKQGIIKPMAANISQLMIVTAPKPQIAWPLLDSYLIIAEYLSLKACIILNKADLPCLDLKERLLEQYVPLGYEVLFTSQQQRTTLPELEGQLQDHTSVFVGQSGVGKSSLIASVLPSETTIQTGSLSVISNLGRHTTSSSTFYHLPSGGAIIDSPGVREFGLWHMQASEIAKGFREFRPFLSKCKFRDCKHHNTPGCALEDAAKKGLISRDRLDNYVKIST